MMAKLQPILKEPVQLSRKTNNDRVLYRVLIGPITTVQITPIQQTLIQYGFSKGITTTG